MLVLSPEDLVAPRRRSELTLQNVNVLVSTSQHDAQWCDDHVPLD